MEHYDWRSIRRDRHRGPSRWLPKLGHRQESRFLKRQRCWQNFRLVSRCLERRSYVLYRYKNGRGASCYRRLRWRFQIRLFWLRQPHSGIATKLVASRNFTNRPGSSPVIFPLATRISCHPSLFRSAKLVPQAQRAMATPAASLTSSKDPFPKPSSTCYHGRIVEVFIELLWGIRFELILISDAVSSG